jgi:hypothetical protein
MTSSLDIVLPSRSGEFSFSHPCFYENPPTLKLKRFDVSFGYIDSVSCSLSNLLDRFKRDWRIVSHENEDWIGFVK